MKQKWLSLLKVKFEKSRLVTNGVLVGILLGLEKLLELEFNCPCSPHWNAWYSAGFFIIPPSISFTVILLIQECKCKCCGKCSCGCWVKNCGKTLSSSVLSIVWLVLVLYDGQYFACARTSWEGSYASFEKLQWCRPENVTEEIRIQLTQRVKFWYVYSQVSACGNRVGLEMRRVMSASSCTLSTQVI